MPYSTLSDIMPKQLSETELIQLTDDVGAGAVDADSVDRAIIDADAEIDSYCGSRHTVPFFPVPVMIRKLSVDIAVYNLFSRSALAMPEERQTRYQNAIRFLRDVSKGMSTLGADAPAEPTDGQPQATTSKTDRVFTTGRASDGSAGTLDNY